MPDSTPTDDRLAVENESGEFDLPDDPGAYPDTLLITVESDWQTAVDKTAARFGDWEDGETVPAKRAFPDAETVRKLLTPQRMALVRSLVDEPADSITALAERVGRDKRQIYDDLSLLEDAGIVYYRSGTGRAKAPFVPYDHVVVEVEITASATHR